MREKKIQSALVSVYHKDGLADIVKKLDELGVKIISTGGTHSFISGLGIEAEKVEDITSYPSILGGRVKTLHPKVFGGILARRDNEGDMGQLSEYRIPEIDLVIVDLYPFSETVASGAGEQDIIEKIDIGGISLIRAAAKNYRDTLIISHRGQYAGLVELLNSGKGMVSLEERRHFAAEAFSVSSEYDTQIFSYFNREEKIKLFRESYTEAKSLRYGENPHQEGIFYGRPGEMIEQLHGKEISYNNLLDIDAALALIEEFDETTFAIIKHNNACGLASRPVLLDAWKDALAGDPVSAFGGVLITNREIDRETATEIDKLFFEVIIAPSYGQDALDILKHKKNRIILKQKGKNIQAYSYRTVLNGVLLQERDLKTEKAEDMKTVTRIHPDKHQLSDLEFANKIVKHSKSNTIVLAGNKQLYASGVGMTSRVDALRFAAEKARSFGFDLSKAVMASDAFFPFADSVEIAYNEGIKAVIQPGGSIRDNDSIDFCNDKGMSMVFTGTRHFKH
ncbi:MAG: bifunctional phosphoribosylaminoimidazolecarboxamide formyltransferase/IMP cyclohydrolase [Bacteroidales bacterium]|jgi:phosphoribosylaminoimidazolecarboxamide formyltransferase/IMP cyclohydrolase|nr:bifunctional phosphoribosylaminoimidazolecarboxamide formyltransferase/IMP cyclohydrolase [Bacteroidales bacterium]